MLQKFFSSLFLLLLATMSISAQAAPVYATNSINTGSAYSSSLINQMAEQNLGDPNTVFGPAFAQLLNDIGGVGQGNETYQGIKQFWNYDLLGSLFANINQTISRWLNHFFKGYLPDIISSLSGVVKSFFLNPNLVKITANAADSNDLSFLLGQLATIVYGIAFDLLFVLFVIAIWQYWTKGSWQGNVSAMSAVGRLICTLGIIVGWPTIYSFEIDLSNEMITAIFASGSNQLQLLDMVMANMFKVSAYSGLLGTMMLSPPIAIGVAHLSGFLSVIAMLALCVLAIVLIYELLYLIALKAMQMALLTTQYVFGPVFLIFLATPGTEKIASGYIRTFAETSLWSFIWIGLLKILVILMYSNFNPWGKIITAIGVLQLMMRVPQFLGRFKASSASSFVNPAFFTTHIKQHAAEYAQKASSYKDQFVSAFTGAFKGAGPSPAFNAAGNAMSAGFSFGNAGVGGNISPWTPISKRQLDYSNDKDKNTSASNPNLSTNSHPSGKRARSPNSHLPVKDFHFGKKDIPGRKQLPRKKDIFNRHSKTGSLDSDNVVDLPTRKQSANGLPEGVAAFLGNSSLPGFNPLNSKPSSSHPAIASSKGTASSQFNYSRFIPFGQTGMSTHGNQLLSTRLTARQLQYGTGEVVGNRQQFTLPKLINSPQTDLQSSMTKVKPKADSHQYHRLAENKTTGYNSSLSNGPLVQQNQQNERHSHNEQTNNEKFLLNKDEMHNVPPSRKKNDLIPNQNNQHSHANQDQRRNHNNIYGQVPLYYAPAVLPGWQRPHRSKAAVAVPLNPAHNATSPSSFVGINSPAASRFYSYYS